MTGHTTDDVAVGLALGELAGHERAAALEHLVACPSCRSRVESLAAITDRLLELAPEDEPPAGFESRTLARVAAAGGGASPGVVRVRAWRGRRLVAVAAAVAMIAGGGVALAVAASRPSDGTSSAEYARQLERVGGRSLRAGFLMDAAGRRVGQAFMYDGSPSWVFVSMKGAPDDGVFTVVCTGAGAASVSWPGLHVERGSGALGWTVPGVRGLTDVRVVDSAGHAAYHAVLEGTPS